MFAALVKKNLRSLPAILLQIPSGVNIEGIFRGINEIKKYVKMRKSEKQIEIESAYW